MCGGGAASCDGSTWCSGSDSNSSFGAEVYIGEVGTYSNDFYSTSGVAWNYTAADNAATKYQNQNGVGVQAYYFGGGPGVNNTGLSNYCFGAKQAVKAASHMANTFGSYQADNQWIMAFDVDSPASAYGFYTSEPLQNLDVWQGFRDYMEGKNPCGDGTNGNDFAQAVVYTGPDTWQGGSSCNSSSGGVMGKYCSLADTPKWSSEYDCGCGASFPGANWGGQFQSFGGTAYEWARQYRINPDYDDAYADIYLPALGGYLNSIGP